MNDNVQSQGRGPAHEKTGHYRTSDMYYAAYLKVAGVPFAGTQREGGRVFFLFEDSETIKELKVGFYNSVKVAALPYADAIKAMKALTHSE
jgi:hypothetical protein